MRYVIYQGLDGTFRFKLVAPNGQILAVSEGYTTRDGCERAIAYVRQASPAEQNVRVTYQTCFISYSANDTAFVERLHAFLSNSDVSTWFAPKDLQIGARTRPALDQAISGKDRVLVVLSENSINSQWVEAEVEAAYERERQNGGEVLVPITIDDHVFATPHGWAANLRRTRNIGSFTQWRDDAEFRTSCSRLLAALRRDAA